MVASTTLARGLGLFSLGLGAYQVLAPGSFTSMIGLRPRPDRDTAARAVGARELGAGAGLLASSAPAGWMWMRVAGDVMDLALLGRAMQERDTRPDRVGLAIASVMGITALDVVGSLVATAESRSDGRNGHDQQATGQTWVAPEHRRGRDSTGDRVVAKSVTVWRPVEEVYGFWRDFSNLPRFMRHLVDVRVSDGDGRRSHWRAKAPLGMTVDWDAEMTEDVPNERISWRSVEGADVRNAGTVRFEPTPDGRGTIVRVELEYDPPAGPLGVAIAKLTGEEPATQTAEDLRRFKQVLELGEIVISEATHGERRLAQRPARPFDRPMELAATAR